MGRIESDFVAVAFPRQTFLSLWFSHLPRFPCFLFPPFLHRQFCPLGRRFLRCLARSTPAQTPTKVQDSHKIVSNREFRSLFCRYGQIDEACSLNCTKSNFLPCQTTFIHIKTFKYEIEGNKVTFKRVCHNLELSLRSVYFGRHIGAHKLYINMVNNMP